MYAVFSKSYQTKASWDTQPQVIRESLVPGDSIDAMPAETDFYVIESYESSPECVLEAESNAVFWGSAQEYHFWYANNVVGRLT